MQIGSFFGFSVIISASDNDCAAESEVCCPAQFTGTDGLYERHLAFDNVMDPAATGPRNSWNNATPRGIPVSVRKSGRQGGFGGTRELPAQAGRSGAECQRSPGIPGEPYQ